MKKRSPCSTCPFRTDIDFPLTASKSQAIVSDIQNDGDFPCHNTTAATGKPPHQSKACIGAAIFLEHATAGGVRANLAFRLREGWLKEFDRDALEMNAPVFRDAGSFIAAKAQLLSLEE